jgi:hypothetical protein
MKNILTTFILFLVISISCFSQEFAKSSSGLIYSDPTVKQLRFIVDSLNLKFKVCELNKVYLSKLQAKAHYVHLGSGDIQGAMKDMQAGISWEDFIKKYRQPEIEKDLVVVRYKYKNYEEKDVVEFSSIELNDEYRHELIFDKNLNQYDQPMKGKWAYSYYGKKDFGKESLNAFYFSEDLKSQPLPEKYARMVQYTYCMIDTNAEIFHENAKRTGRRNGYISAEGPNVKTFMGYIENFTKAPEYDDKGDYRKRYHQWDSTRYLVLDSLHAKDAKFNMLVAEAVKEALEKGGTDDIFEEYAGRYYSRKAELELKRNRRVVGGCSMDNSPREHARNIAVLSAETINWEIFLRSHLNIMNDRFERVSDGSYAWEGRKTYIGELEVLDINVFDLLLGISLRIENPSKNHYYGDIGRLGRALAETRQPDEIEKRMFEIISDKTLDDHNRILIYYLFLNYNYNLENLERQAVNKHKLSIIVQSLPDYISSRINKAKK